MGVFDKLMKRAGPEKPKEINASSSNVTIRARALIEELVSPLSRPNQLIIEELLTVIDQSSNLPEGVVNKEAVQSTIKKLLFQLIEPIPNPNKIIIDELLQLVMNPEKTLSRQDLGFSPDRSFDSKVEETRMLKGQAGLKLQQMEAMAKAPYPTQELSSREQLELLNRQKEKEKKKDKETKTVMNLLLEQIKELIAVTNGINAKIKNHQVRLDAIDSMVAEMKNQSKDHDERMAVFEKNMEKFIGLYEVVTNQYNPFVESSYPSEISNLGQKSGQQSFATALQAKPKDPEFFVKDVKITGLHQLGDCLITLSDQEFGENILEKKNLLISWLEFIGQGSLAGELLNLQSKSDYIKAVFKAIHAK